VEKGEMMKNALRAASFLFLLIGVASAFTINSTSDWGTGTRTNSSDNYEVETNGDNLHVFDGWASLGDMYSDRFTFDDADGITWKWWADDLMTAWGVETSGLVSTDISDGKYNFYLANASSQIPAYPVIIRGLNTTVQTDVDMRIDVFLPASDTGDVPEAILLLWKEDDSGAYCYLYPYFDAVDTWWLIYECSDDTPTTLFSGSIPIGSTGDMNLSLRIERLGDVCVLYYDAWMSGTWTFVDSTTSYGSCFSGEARPMLYSDASWHNDDNITISWDNFWMETELGEPARDAGTWESLPIPYSTLNSTTISYYSQNEYTCVDSVEWLADGVSVAEYTDDLCNISITNRQETQESAENGGFDYETGYWARSSSNVIDNDWDSCGYSTSLGTLFFSYNIPFGATTNSLWHIKDGGLFGDRMLTLPPECWSNTELNLMVQSKRTYAKPFWRSWAIWSCWNGASWEILSSTSAGYTSNAYIYEEEMLWDINTSRITLTEDNLTSGTFTNINSTFNIRVNMTGDGASTLALDSLTSNEEAVACSGEMVFIKLPARQIKSSDSTGAAVLMFAVVGTGAVAWKYTKKGDG
jgi:hypothetical protein